MRATASFKHLALLGQHSLRRINNGKACVGFDMHASIDRFEKSTSRILRDSMPVALNLLDFQTRSDCFDRNGCSRMKESILEKQE